MPGSILPLPVMLDEEDRKIYEKLEAPKSIVVRYGYMKLIAELPYDGDAKPGCGSKLVIRSSRGIEIGEMLTTTCANSGCGKSVSRKEMLEYIENSGGKNYPFSTQGKVLRVATVEDILEQQRLDANKPNVIKLTRAVVRELDLKMKLVDVEMLLGGERVIFHYTSEDWVDFRELVKRLAAEYQTRIEMHQVNARDEARLVADYEKCGQHCCCKQFLKVLKPVSMRSAKVQKATLDPTKISGRCGRLMCCLRYEDETYDDLRKRLPKRQTRWMTDDGPGTVLDTQILTQLVLIQLDRDGSTAAYPLENITAIGKEEDEKYRAELEARERGQRERDERREERREQKGQSPRNDPRSERPSEARPGPQDGGERPDRGEPRRDEPRKGEQRREEPRKEDRPPRKDEPRREEPRRPKPGQPLRESEVESREGPPREGPPKEEPVDEREEMAGVEGAGGMDEGDDAGGEMDGADQGEAGGGAPGDPAAPAGQGGQPGQPGESGRKRKRRRRRRRRGGGGGGGGGVGPGGAPSGDGPPSA